MVEGREKEKGAALASVLAILFLMTFFGMTAFRWSLDELSISANHKAGVQARYIAESGVALMRQWFQMPETVPDIGSFPNGLPPEGRAGFLKRRRADAWGAPSFLDSRGVSQFSGSKDEPDLWYQSDSADAVLLGEAFSGIGRVTDLRLFGPVTPGAVASLEATGTTILGISRTVRVELIPGPVPPAPAAVQAGTGLDGPMPIRVHWGDVKVPGPARLSDSLTSIPIKDASAFVNGAPYGVSDRRDPWLDFYVGGPILNPSAAACSGCTEPFSAEGYSHLHQWQVSEIEDFGIDQWNYGRLKAFAKDRGVYYWTDRDGTLYGGEAGGLDSRTTLLQALSSAGAGGRGAFVFVDTIDRRPPDGSNLPTLDLPIDYLEGIFSIQAHVVLREAGSGKQVLVQSPPPEGWDFNSGRQAVTLSNVHLKGLLSVAGRLTVEGRPNVFGGLIAQQGFAGPGEPEVWYDADLGTGYYPGLPTVMIRPGSWYLR